MAPLGNDWVYEDDDSAIDHHRQKVQERVAETSQLMEALHDQKQVNCPCTQLYGFMASC